MLTPAALIDGRKEALTVYMQLLIMRQDVQRNRDIQRFLQVDSPSLLSPTSPSWSSSPLPTIPNVNTLVDILHNKCTCAE